MAKSHKKYSPSAIILTFLLAFRIGGHIFSFILIPMINSNLVILAIIGLSTASYFVALVGVLKRAKWGLILTLIIATIDIVALIVWGWSEESPLSNLMILILDLALLELSFNILRRIKQ